MKCAKCGLDLLQGTRQCPKCGLVNEFEQAAPVPKKKRSAMIYAIIGLAIVGVLALVFFVLAGGKNVTSAPGGVNREDSNITTAPPGLAAPSGIMAAPPGKPTGEKTPPGVTKPKPPQEVVDYLAYVKKVEEHRQMLLKDTGAALTLMVGGQAMSMEKMMDWVENDKAGGLTDPLSDVKNETGRQYKNWVNTLKFFDSKPAPPECREFSGAYREVLFSETAKVGQVVGILDKADLTKTQNIGSATAQLMKLKGDPNLQEGIDKSADNADAKLTTLVSYYDMEKPFDVPREKQGGSIMGF